MSSSRWRTKRARCIGKRRECVKGCVLARRVRPTDAIANDRFAGRTHVDQRDQLTFPGGHALARSTLNSANSTKPGVVLLKRYDSKDNKETWFEAEIPCMAG